MLQCHNKPSWSELLTRNTGNMELQCSRMMWIVFVVVITAVLTEVNSTARFISKNELKNKTTRTMNAGNVNDNTMQKEKGKFKVPSSAEGTKTSVDHESLNNTKKTTTKTQAGTNMFSTTDNEQKNLSYSTVNIMYPTNSSLATNNLTALSHDRDNSEHIWTIVGLTVFLLVAAVVGGLLFLCYKRLLCFKRKARSDSEMPFMSTKKNEHVDEDNVMKVEVEKIKITDTTEDVMDISAANTNSPVFVDECTSKFNNIQPTDARK